MDNGTLTSQSASGAASMPSASTNSNNTSKTKSVGKEKDTVSAAKRRCVSTACIACRRRKSKCDGNLPKCAACASVYLTDCEYAPHTDHRRKGVYKKDADPAKTKNSTLQILIHSLLNQEEEEAFDLLRQIRACDNLEELAHSVENKEKGIDIGSPDSPIYGNHDDHVPQFEAELSGKMGDLVVDGSVKFIGGTSNLIWLDDTEMSLPSSPSATVTNAVKPREEAILSWTTVTKDKDQILHLMNMYFCWHYAYFTTLSKELFYRDFLTGNNSHHCSSLLVNVMLALGCHFSSRAITRADPEDSTTVGDHFFAEAKRLLHENDEFAVAKLCTVQALALMSVREAGCGRESKGWVYSGMSFRMASDLGLNIDIEPINSNTKLSDEDIDARRITFWGCFFFDKCWSNYLGRLPQLLPASVNVKKPEVFASEDSEVWSPYTDSGIVHAHSQPARTRAVALQMLKLAEISSDLLSAFYQPQNVEKPLGRQTELKRLSDIHTRLEAWKKELPGELDPKDGQLPQVLLMHMFYQLLYIHLYRPFLKYTKATSPLPSHISPRKFCTQAAGAISKLFRLYKRTHGLRQICNIAVYIAHSACTIHLLNLPDKNARRDIIHGVKQLEEIGECWTCARRTLRILGLCAERWKIDLPEEANASFVRTRQRWVLAEPSPAAMSPGAISSVNQQSAAHLATDPVLSDVPIYQPASQQQPPPKIIDPPAQTHPTNAMFSLQPSTHTFKKQTVGRTSAQPQIDLDMSQPQRTNTLKPLTQLTKAQQDRWNSHLARMAPAGTRLQTAPSNDMQTKNAALLFGGVDSLMEESQDWWYNDQSQLALGFDNWNSPSTAEWSGAGNVMAGAPVTPESSMNSPATSTQFHHADMVPRPFHGMPATGAAPGRLALGATQMPAPTTVPPQSHLRHSQQMTNMSGSNRGMFVQSSPNHSTAQKRLNSFDFDDDDADDLIY